MSQDLGTPEWIRKTRQFVFEGSPYWLEVAGSAVWSAIDCTFGVSVKGIEEYIRNNKIPIKEDDVKEILNILEREGKITKIPEGDNPNGQFYVTVLTPFSVTSFMRKSTIESAKMLLSNHTEESK